MDELERFKTEIHLAEFVTGWGYVRDEKISSANCFMMRHENGDKLGITYVIPALSPRSRPAWYYINNRDESDSGTIIDFLQHRGAGNLGEVRKVLRGWRGESKGRPALFPTPKPMAFDRAMAVLGWENAVYRVSVPYLKSRGLDDRIMGSPQFIKRFKIDPKRGNILFPHYDQEGLCGFEIKNRNFTGFSKNGSKGLWFSVCRPSDTTIVLAESAIDGISYHVLHPDDKSRYFSTGGKMNPNQPALIRAALSKMPAGSTVVLAFDKDKDGEKLSETIRDIAPDGLKFERPLPPFGKDWNEALKNKLGL